jgi:hypothetical protein
MLWLRRVALALCLTACATEPPQMVGTEYRAISIDGHQLPWSDLTALQVDYTAAELCLGENDQYRFTLHADAYHGRPGNDLDPVIGTYSAGAETIVFTDTYPFTGGGSAVLRGDTLIYTDKYNRRFVMPKSTDQPTPVCPIRP